MATGGCKPLLDSYLRVMPRAISPANSQLKWSELKRANGIKMAFSFPLCEPLRFLLLGLGRQGFYLFMFDLWQCLLSTGLDRFITRCEFSLHLDVGKIGTGNSKNKLNYAQRTNYFVAMYERMHFTCFYEKNQCAPATVYSVKWKVYIVIHLCKNAIFTRIWNFALHIVTFLSFTFFIFSI